MNEQSKAAVRRAQDWDFVNLYFVGRGLDLGCGRDPVKASLFPGILSVDTMEVGDGDAQTLTWKSGQSVTDGSLDWVHASHLLEHLESPLNALIRWCQALKSGGHLIATLPEEDLYERGHWPSIFSNEHLWTFTINKKQSWSPRSINLLKFVEYLNDTSLERLSVQRRYWSESIPDDQTLGPAECAIEMVLRKL